MEISLQELAAALEKTDVWQGYVDTAEGRILLLDEEASPEEASCEEAHIERVLSIEENWQRYVPLPDLYEEEIRSIMQAFGESAPRQAREAFLNVWKGSSARFCFRRAIRQFSLEEAWRTHLSKSLLKLARDWCEENRIAYRE